VRSISGYQLGGGIAVGGLLGLGLTLLWLHTASVQPPAAAAIPQPADTFMHSVAVRDGELGWAQLCPEAQLELPLEELVQHTTALRAADSAYQVNVTMEFVRAEPRPEGGERRFYLASARQFGALMVQQTFVVRTRASGCVEALE
jgi:hypothetical protein